VIGLENLVENFFVAVAVAVVLVVVGKFAAADNVVCFDQMALLNFEDWYLVRLTEQGLRYQIANVPIYVTF
jgi:hypothetical protein